MLIYEIATGKLSEVGHGLLAIGYSGNGKWKNDPTAQKVQGHGPIPEGIYTMQLIDGDYEGKKAPVIRLLPEADNQMFGRSGFLIHGESLSHPGEASNGCIIQPKFARERAAFLASEGDDKLQVIPGAVVPDPEISV